MSHEIRFNEDSKMAKALFENIARGQEIFLTLRKGDGQALETVIFDRARYDFPAGTVVAEAHTWDEHLERNIDNYKRVAEATAVARGIL